MEFTSINATLHSVASVINEIKTNVTNYYTTKSLTEVTKLTRVEPLTIVSKDCINLEYMPDVMQSLLSIFSGYYLQAVSMLTSVNDIEVVRILDKLNPDRDDSGFLLTHGDNRSKNLVVESYSKTLPIKGIAIEAGYDKKDNDNSGQSKDSITTINEMTNLSVGKLLNVNISYNKTEAGSTKDSGVAKSVTIPVAIRLMASVIPNSTITHLLAFKTEDSGLVERFHAWRSGRIGFIKDLIFCQDLIDEYKKAMIGDEQSTLVEIMRRVNNAKKYGLVTKNPSLVSASNIFVISEEVARDIEQKLGGKLSNANIRNKAFENTYAMMIVVIDREWERVTFYSRGLAASSDLSIKEIKNASKGKGPDIGEILKSFNMGVSPSF